MTSCCNSRKRKISKIILGGVLANLCVDLTYANCWNKDSR
jgi:hypothetical protein